MRHPRAILCAALLLALLLPCGRSGIARADRSEVSSLAARVQNLEDERTKLEAHLAELERQASALSSQIDQLKRQGRGVRRDQRLHPLLAKAQAGADELDRTAAERRWRVAALTLARRSLVAACDHALASPTLSEARRLELTRLRTAQVTELALPARPLDIERAHADPLDGPRELSEKADLLRDSEDKLHREAARLKMRIAQAQRQRHLRERAGAIDQDLFGEEYSDRKVARTATTAATSGSAPAAAMNSGAAPPQTAPGSGALPGVNPGAPSAMATDVTVLRDLVDPSTLNELRLADGSDDPDLQARALERAERELEGLAHDLDQRARALSARADKLKGTK